MRRGKGLLELLLTPVPAARALAHASPERLPSSSATRRPRAPSRGAHPSQGGLVQEQAFRKSREEKGTLLKKSPRHFAPSLTAPPQGTTGAWF